jgi:LytS/YehU family sensor histidine kinase
LVENAIKHGMLVPHRQMTVQIKINRNKETLKILVMNDGKPIDFKKYNPSKGTGLNNLKERLSLLYPGRYYFNIFNEEDTNWRIVEAAIPLHYL